VLEGERGLSEQDDGALDVGHGADVTVPPARPHRRLRSAASEALRGRTRTKKRRVALRATLAS
jgi:hypothetical protein